MIDKVAYKLEINRVLMDAERFLTIKQRSITDAICKNSPGTPNDYYSNGDYWWPNENTETGLPFVRKDGQSYPGAFSEHRYILTETSCSIGALTLAYLLTQDSKYLNKVIENMKVFFVDPKTRTNPSLLYAQAIPGVCTGRGIGIIDTLHLIDTAVSVKLLSDRVKGGEEEQVLRSVSEWFEQYLSWMLHHPYGITELNELNNHSVCFCVQAAAFATISGSMSVFKLCKEKYIEYLNRQMAPDGSFPKELARTKPYGYSLFIVDNLTTLAVLIHHQLGGVFEMEGKEKQTLEKALDFIYPYIQDKGRWPYNRDVEHFDSLPIGFPFLLFAGCQLKKENLATLWFTLPHSSTDQEVMRNTAIKYPLLWVELFHMKLP